MRVGFIALCLLAALWFAGLWQFAQMIPRMPSSDPIVTDAVVVLTGGAGRLGHGLDVLNAGKARRLLISGVGAGMTLAKLPALYPNESMRLPKSAGAIVLDTKAGSTFANAEQTALWIAGEHYRSLRLVTAAYHMPRSLSLFRRAMPGVAILPDPAFPKDFRRSGWWADANSMRLVLSEYHKYLLTRLAQIIAVE